MLWFGFVRVGLVPLALGLGMFGSAWGCILFKLDPLELVSVRFGIVSVSLGWSVLVWNGLASILFSVGPFGLVLGWFWLV